MLYPEGLDFLLEQDGDGDGMGSSKSSRFRLDVAQAPGLLLLAAQQRRAMAIWLVSN